MAGGVVRVCVAYGMKSILQRPLLWRAGSCVCAAGGMKYILRTPLLRICRHARDQNYFRSDRHTAEAWQFENRENVADHQGLRRNHPQIRHPIYAARTTINLERPQHADEPASISCSQPCGRSPRMRSKSTLALRLPTSPYHPGSGCRLAVAKRRPSVSTPSVRQNGTISLDGLAVQ